MKKFYVPIVLTVVLFASVAFSAGTDKLSNDNIVQGLKTALTVGTDSAINKTSMLNGFYGDPLIRIPLPPQADIIYKYKDNFFFSKVGLTKLLNDAEISVNRAAEDASKEARTILKDAIKKVTISDGIDILKGKNPSLKSQEVTAFDSTAATAYLKSLTYEKLKIAFAPKINASLNKKLVSNMSTLTIWNTLISSYNTVATKIPGASKVESDLGAFVTEKTLDGIFLKLGQEEIKIRKSPANWAASKVGGILKKVFGK